MFAWVVMVPNAALVSVPAVPYVVLPIRPRNGFAIPVPISVVRAASRFGDLLSNGSNGIALTLLEYERCTWWLPIYPTSIIVFRESC